MTGPLDWLRSHRRMRVALLLIGTGCTNFTGPSTCVDDPGRRPDAYYGAERWCDGCIAREGLRRGPCAHHRQRCVHGDEIIHVGFNRACCLDCGRYLPNLPAVCSVTGAPHSAVGWLLLGDGGQVTEEEPEPEAYQPPFPGFGPPVCARHEFKGKGRWRPCVRCWTAGWFPLRRR